MARAAMTFVQELGVPVTVQSRAVLPQTTWWRKPFQPRAINAKVSTVHVTMLERHSPPVGLTIARQSSPDQHPVALRTKTLDMPLFAIVLRPAPPAPAKAVHHMFALSGQRKIALLDMVLL